MNRSCCTFFLLLTLLIAVWSCGQHPSLAGKYRATNPHNSEKVVLLVLQSNGNGSWTFEDEEVPLRWEQKGKEIWIHHKGGGVIAGKLDGNGQVELVMPGVGPLLFKKQQ